MKEGYGVEIPYPSQLYTRDGEGKGTGAQQKHATEREN